MKWLKQQTLFKKADHIENWALKSKEEKNRLSIRATF